MENDYHLVSPLSLHVPSHSLPLSSISFSSPIQHARSSVTLSPLSRLPITHTVSARQLLPRKQSDSVARHLELCSQ